MLKILQIVNMLKNLTLDERLHEQVFLSESSPRLLS